MNELAFERDYTALLTGVPQLQAALSAEITERDSLVLWNENRKIASFSPSVFMRTRVLRYTATYRGSSAKSSRFKGI